MLPFLGFPASSRCLSALTLLVILARVNAEVDPTADNSVVLDLDECPQVLPNGNTVDKDASTNSVFTAVENVAGDPVTTYRYTLPSALAMAAELQSGTHKLTIRCQPQKATVLVIDDRTAPGEIEYTPHVSAFGCDLFTFEVEEISSDDLRYRVSSAVLVTITSVNDRPSNVENYFYNQVNEYVLVPNRGEFLGEDALNYAYEGANNQRLRLPLPPESGYDADREILRYTITSPPALGTLWLENRLGAIACVVTSERMCEGIGENNIFSYLPAPDMQNFEDSFSYKVDDCVKPRTSHTECFEAASTIWVRTGAFQGTGVQEEEARLRGPRTIYTAADPLRLQEDIPIIGFAFYQFADAGGEVTDDLQFRLAFPPKEGSVDFLCDGYMLVRWSRVGLPSCDTSLISGFIGYNSSIVNSLAGRLGVFRYTPGTDFSGTDVFRFTTYSVAFQGNNGTFAAGTIPVNLEVSPVNDAPEIVPFEQALGVNNEPGVLPGYVQVPMGELLDTTYPNMGSVNVFGRDSDSTLLYVQMMTNFKYGRLYANITNDGVANRPVLSSLVQESDVLTMNLPNATARSDTFTLTMRYTVIEDSAANMYGAPFDSAIFRVSDDPTMAEGTVSRSAEVFLQVQCAKGYYILTGMSRRVPEEPYMHGECKECAPGSFSAQLGSEACSPCAVGTFSVGSSPQCDLCPLHSYQNMTGQTGCFDCPLNRGTVSGRTSITLQTASSDITKCICQKANTSGDDLMAEGARGFYGPYGRPCYPCPGPDMSGLPYDGGAEWTKCETNGMIYPVSRFGYFTDVKVLPVVIRQCQPEDACPEHYTEREMLSDPCKSGYEGHGCSSCSPRYTRFFGKCSACGGAGKVGFAAGFFFYGLFYLLLTYLISASIKSQPEMYIALNYSQMVGLFGSYQLRWPANVESLLKAISFVNVAPELLRPECAWSESWDYSSNWLLVMLAPVLFAGWILIVTAVLMLHNEFVKRYGPMLKERYPQFFVRVHGKPLTWERGLSKLKVYIGIVMTVAQDRAQILITLRRQIHAYLTFLSLAYTFLVLKLFEYFQCAKNIDGNYYLTAEPSVQCYQYHESYLWGRLLPAALAAIVFYVIGIPALFAFLLYSTRKNKNGKGPLGLMSSLYSRYDHMWYGWEIVLMAMKFFLSASLYLFSGVSNINALRQAVYAMCIILFTLTFFSYAAPYDNWLLNQYQTVCYMSLFFQVFSGLLFTGDISTGFSEKISRLVIFFIWIPWMLFILAKFDVLITLVQRIYQSNVTQRKADEIHRMTKGDLEDKLSHAVELRLASMAKKDQAFGNIAEILTSAGMRITQELWYEAAHDPTILMPAEAELRPLFDQLHDELDDSATMELESRELEEEFDNALRSRGMVMETLAQNKVADNLEIKGAIEKVLLSNPRRGPIDFIVDVFKALKARFDMEKTRAGSSYTQHLAELRKLEKKKSKMQKMFTTRTRTSASS